MKNILPCTDVPESKIYNATKCRFVIFRLSFLFDIICSLPMTVSLYLILQKIRNWGGSNIQVTGRIDISGRLDLNSKYYFFLITVKVLMYLFAIQAYLLFIRCIYCHFGWQKYELLGGRGKNMMICYEKCDYKKEKVE